MLKKLRKSHILFFLCVFGFALCLTNGFANDDDAILEGGFDFPTPNGVGHIEGAPESLQKAPHFIFGSADFEKMRDLPQDSQDYQLGTKVGWFRIAQRNNPGRSWICTGFLVGPDLFMTNHHCIHDEDGLLQIETARIYMDYYQEPGEDPTRGGITARVSEILRMDEEKDYALLRLDSPIGNTYGWLELDTTTDASTGQSVKIIHHSQGRSKEISRRNSQIVDIPADWIAEFPELNYALGYLADTEGGSSGGPVFLLDGTGVIAINHSSWFIRRGDGTIVPQFNAGTLMAYIVPEIQQWLPSGPPTPPEPPPDPGLPPIATGIHMYWTDTGTGQIQRANLDGSNVETLAQGLTSPTDIAVDVTGEKIYWTNTGLGQIQRANLDGSNVEDLIFGLSSPTGIAVDAAGNKVYWTDTGTGAIQCANLDGSNVEDLIFGLSSPTGIAVDAAGNKVYWTDTGTGAIQCANLDGSNQQDLIFGLSSPTGIAVDAAGNKIYWTNTGTGAIQCANLDGSNQQDLIFGLTSPTGIALNVPEGQMHWTSPGTGAIQRANLDGTNQQDLVTGLISPAGITLSIPQSGGPFNFDPISFPDQTFTVGTAVSLSLPNPTGGIPPYTVTLTPELPAGLYFEPRHAGDQYGFIGGTPTTVAPPRLYTYTGRDSGSETASLTFTITVTSTSRLDVNGDGVVDVKDLVIVAMAYGTRVPAGTDLPADVNLDLVVNLIDLTLVARAIDAAGGGANTVSLADIAAALEGVAAAPNALSGGNLAYRNVAAALADAKLEKGVPETVLNALRQLLAEMERAEIPESTALLPNYPNPFNPETWIPYHLATDAAVVLTIYDVRGSMVRELRLGHQPAGVYESRARAAYWDGKNQLGEHVASGVYFYTLTAGDFTATRKLLIAK